MSLTFDVECSILCQYIVSMKTKTKVPMKTKHIYLVQILTCIDPWTGKKVKWYHSEMRPTRATSCADATKNVFVGATEKIGKVYKSV